MKRITAILLVLVLLVCCPTKVYATQAGEEETTEHPKTTEYPQDPSREPDIVSEAAIVMNSETGQIIYEKNAYKQEYPASITKIITTLIALEHKANYDDVFTMTESAVWGIERDSTHIGLDVGEQVTVKDLLYATMVKSANECAYALAEYVAGDVESFAKLMNEKAQELGCQNTHFVTPNGLHDDDHYTCAYDMALITKAALQYDQFREIAGSKTYVVPPTNLSEEERPLPNGNKLIQPGYPDYYYEYCEGGKTGYTTVANNTLVSFAKKDGLELICVVLNCDGAAYTYSDSKALYNYCFNNYSYFYPLKDYSLETIEDNSENDAILKNYYLNINHDMVDMKVDENYRVMIHNSLDTSKIEKVVSFYDKADGDCLGEIAIMYDGETLGTSYITNANPKLSSTLKPKETEDKKKITLQKFQKVAKIIIIIVIILLAILLVALLISTIAKKIKRGNRRRNYAYRRRRRKRDDDYYF